MPFGAQLLPGGGARFRLWAPSSPRVSLELRISTADEPLVLEMRSDQGWHEVTVDEAAAGWRYQFVVCCASSATLVVPDPASRSNPDGVHGASAVVDPRAYSWRSAQWRGRDWSDAVVYELHVGAFTQEGTFTAAAQRLPDLADTGITAVQLMPLAAFPGRRSWGYDGVLQYAPAACYGSPEELKALVDSAHDLGLMVLLDVVYNHFGPEGNYLYAYCPEFFNSAHGTPWGAAINFDGKRSVTVRDFFVHNALYWVEEFRFDGLRLDAVHAMRDRSDPDIVCEIARALDQGPGRTRKVHLVLENDANQARYLARDAAGRPLLATAQWDDDVHHSLHVLTSGEADGYYADYAVKPLEKLGRALTEGFAYQGEYSIFSDRSRGEPSAQLPPTAFVAFLQNHDMIGNRARGERIHSLADPQLLNAAYACLLLSPEVPMLFMGEEFDASTPFLYFCDFELPLAQAVAQGRHREFSRFAAFSQESARAVIPDPNAESTFEASKLNWAERDEAPHQRRLLWIRDLLALRRRFLAPHLGGITHGGRFRTGSGVLCAQWTLAHQSLWTIVAHFGTDPAKMIVPPGKLIYNIRAVATDSGVRLEPGAVLVTHKASPKAAEAACA